MATIKKIRSINISNIAKYRGIAIGDITTIRGLELPSAVPEFTGGLTWDESQATGGYTRTGDLEGETLSVSPGNSKLPIHALMKRCLVQDNGTVNYYLCPTDSTKKADCSTPSVLTGADGQVMVEIPKFYYKYSYAVTSHTWEISETQEAGFILHPAFNKNGSEVDHRYMSAYEGSMWDATDSQMVSDAEAVTNMYASGDKLCSITGQCPKTYETRAEFRAMGDERGANWRQMDYDLASAIQLLYLIEYADFDSQATIGMGRTELTGGTWVADSYIGRTGKSNSDGNGTNSVGGNTNNAYMTYRGIENFFGNIWKWMDGINVNNNVPYVTNNDSHWVDDTSANYTDLGITLSTDNGWQVILEQISRGFLPATSVGGSSSTYICDYYYQNAGWRVATLGGNANYDANAGVFYLNVYYASSTDYAYVYVGGRLCF